MYRVELKEESGQGLRVFDNGVTHHHQSVERICRVIEQLSRAKDAADDVVGLDVDGFALHQRWNDIADRLYTLLGSEEEAIKYVRTTSIIFPELFVIE